MKPIDYVVMLGLDAQKKPRAAKFDGAQAEQVRKAAGLMGMRVGWSHLTANGRRSLTN